METTELFLLPVWLHRGFVTIEDGRLDLPVVSLPATVYAPPAKEVPPPLDPGSTIGHVGRFATGAWWIDSDVPSRQIHAQKNANDFVTAMAAADWRVVRNAGNDDTLMEEWRARAACGVDLTDFAYYAGHAEKFGWYFKNDGGLQFRLSPSDVGKNDPRNRLFGQRRLLWIGICACGPFQDEAIGGEGDVFKRWSPAFDGLHLIAAYGTGIGARDETGRRFGVHIQSHTIADAWFRAAREQQIGADVQAAVLYASSSDLPDSDPLCDRVAPFVKFARTVEYPNTFTAIWVPA